MAEFDVTVLTIRTGTMSIRVEADDAAAARTLVQSECNENRCHCHVEWCTDDVQSDVVDVRPSREALSVRQSTVEPGSVLRDRANSAV
jgi:hypothetical protein